MQRNIGLIIRREYLSRIRKRSFIVMSLLGPLIMAGVIIFAFWSSLEESEDQKILVIDDSYPFFADLEGTSTIALDIQDISLAKAEALLEVSDYTGILYLPEKILANKSAQLIFKKQPSFRVQRQLEERLQQYLEISKLKEFNLTESDYRRLKAPVTISTFQYQGPGQDAERADILPAIVGQIFSILIFFFIFLYSVSVMRGVIEEKTNRIIEVMVSSVRPFQLMMGKIIGVGAVGLTQFLIWIVLTFTIVSIGQTIIIGNKYVAGAEPPGAATEMIQEQMHAENALSLTQISADDNLFNQIRRVNFPLMIGLFLFYFIGGYLLYSALMAAVGSAVDSDTDTQQFVLPVTFPLLLAYFLSFQVFANPGSTMAIWLSIIPFTSPIIMMIRVSYGIPSADLWQVYLSCALLIATFIAAAWVSARVYRTGILMYGKKASLRELLKWITFR
ncbi:MAG: ABC transporter permease [Flavobacteriales bacterium]|nr:ABC transporter permease [Flavobacteriales bacterium]